MRTVERRPWLEIQIRDPGWRDFVWMNAYHKLRYIPHTNNKTSADNFLIILRPKILDILHPLIMTANLELHLGDLEAASQRIPADKPYVMMNMMNFKPVAQYPTYYESPKSTSPSGREAYITYRDAFAKRAAELGVTPPEVLFLGQAHTNLMAGPHEGESWDFILLVKFENFASFRSVLEDEVYLKDIRPHRVAAVQDFRSFAVTELRDL